MMAMAFTANLTFPSANAAFPGINGKIVFGSERGGFGSELYIANPDGSELKRLTFSQGDDVSAALSPDGTRIVFTSQRDHLADDLTAEIYVMDTNGNDVRRLTFNAFYESSPTWSPDGTLIAYSGDCDGSNPPSICIMNADGSSAPTPLPGAEPGDFSPTFSPDGTKITFSHINSVINNPSTEIYVMNVDGTDRTQLTSPGFHFYDNDPDWSPDGTQIAFWRNAFTNSEGDIYLVNVDGSGEIALTNTPDVDERRPSWSPDGTKIAFQSFGANCTPEACGPDIWMMNADGSNPTVLGLNDPDEDYEPNWGAAVATGIIADATNQATGQSMYAGGRAFYGQQFSPEAEIINKVVDCATVELRRHDAPPGNAEIGFYDSNMKLVKLFGTIEVSTLTTGYKAYEFCLPTSDSGHLILENQILAVSYNGGDAVNRIDVRRSNFGAGPDYDGIDSYHVNYDTSWHIYNTEGNSRDLLFKLINGLVSVNITPGASSRTDDAFSPNPLILSVGETVTWTNKDFQPHTVTSGTGPADPNSGQEFNSSPNFDPILAPQGQFGHTFTQAGEFPYSCQLHPNMVGTVSVN